MNEIISWIAVVLWMSLLFYFSHQPATTSSELSTGITKSIIKVVEKVMPSATFDLRRLNHIVRKHAHFIIYFVLGVFVLHALGSASIGIALLICVIYAMSDEFHQLFIPGRGAQIKDVLIDSAGASVGIGVYWIVDMLINSYL